MDLNQIMKQAQDMQQQMQEMQKEIASQEFEGQSGGGLVLITMTGNGEMKKVSIDPTLLKADEKEMLEDLIVAAFSEAKAKADEASKNSMSGAFGDLGGMIPGLKF